MLIIQDQIWGRVTQNRSQGRATWYFSDEFHLLLKEEQTAAYSAEIWKRFRKWGGVPTGATQNGVLPGSGVGARIYALLNVIDRKSTRLNSSHSRASRMPSSA